MSKHTPADFRVAFTRVLYTVKNKADPSGYDRDMAALVMFADHMRTALARIGDKGVTIEEAQRIAKLARMGEDFAAQTSGPLNGEGSTNTKEKP